ncbi:hypothetical protein Q7P37_008108 [Cladosporium fusiforme]
MLGDFGGVRVDRWAFSAGTISSLLDYTLLILVDFTSHYRCWKHYDAQYQSWYFRCQPRQLHRFLLRESTRPTHLSRKIPCTLSQVYGAKGSYGTTLQELDEFVPSLPHLAHQERQDEHDEPQRADDAPGRESILLNICSRDTQL